MEGVKTIITLLVDLATFLWLTLSPPNTLAAENLFLRKQLAMFRSAKPNLAGLITDPNRARAAFQIIQLA